MRTQLASASEVPRSCRNFKVLPPAPQFTDIDTDERSNFGDQRRSDESSATSCISQTDNTRHETMSRRHVMFYQ